MGVSRETSLVFSSVYRGYLKKNSCGSISLSNVDLLGLILPFHGASYLVVDDVFFESVFYLLYKESFPSFCVLTNKVFDSPVGFKGSLDRFKNNFSLYGDKSDRFVLIDRSTYRSRRVTVFQDSEVFSVGGGVDYNDLLSALNRAEYWRGLGAARGNLLGWALLFLCLMVLLIFRLVIFWCTTIMVLACFLV